MTKRPTRAMLEQRVADLEAQLKSRARNAVGDVAKAGEDKFFASAVVVTITALGGRVIVAPTAVRNGLSEATISALQDDFRKSLKIAENDAGDGG